MKKQVLFFAIVLPLLFANCDNFFHDLIPPDGDRIEAFYVPGQMSVEIGENTITAYVAPGTDLTKVIPYIHASKGATVFPVTIEYAMRAFGDERTFGIAMQLYTSGNITDTVINKIRENKNFTRPVIDMPISFGASVDFLVISGIGTIRQYTVLVEEDTGEGRFKSFKFDKFYNPDVVSTAIGTINTTSKTVRVYVSYPVDNIASYQLTPAFETYNGARVYLDEKEWRSGETLVDFVKPPDSSDLSSPDYATQTKTLTLRRTGYADTVWTLIVNFSEDPNTDNRITDFRFTKSLNPLINADYVAAIANYNSSSGDTGNITVTVYYNGAKPEELRASFISPGTVTVNDVTQTSGCDTQDFSAPLQYVVTSMVGGLVRTYTVTVTLVSTADPLPQITYFSFRTEQNPSLSSSSIGLIDHNARLILIEAAYDGDAPPYYLIPQFSATGTVTVKNSTQLSGYYSQNFKNPVVYTVTNPNNPTLKREYRVEVQFVRNLSSGAEITTFFFRKADNPDLVADVQATVNQATGVITATLLFETPGGDRTLVPRWTSQGRIESNGVMQISGESERQFYMPQAYRATSADGVFQRNYTVTIQEVNSRIYVKHDAAGRNDGTSWENAYRNLSGDALNDPSRFSNYPDVMKEVWIAEGTYAVENGYVYPNTSYIGGFRGDEASLDARDDPASCRAVITGDMGGGRRAAKIFTSSYSSAASGIYSFDYLQFTEAGDGTSSGAGISISESNDRTVQMSNLVFINLGGNYAAGVYISGANTNVTINSCTFENTIANFEGAFFIYARTVTVNNSSFVNCFAWGSYDIGYISSTDRARINNCVFADTLPHPLPMVDMGMSDSSYIIKPLLGLRGNTTVSNCQFINLQTNQNRNGTYVISSSGTNLTVTNSTFYLNHPFVRALFTTCNTSMSGVNIYRNNGNDPLITVRYGVTLTYRSNCKVDATPNTNIDIFGLFIETWDSSIKILLE